MAEPVLSCSSKSVFTGVYWVVDIIWVTLWFPGGPLCVGAVVLKGRRGTRCILLNVVRV